MNDTLIAKIQRLKNDEPKLVEYFVDRLLLGQKYSFWTAAGEKRDLFTELAAELIDGCAYMCMEALRKAEAEAAAVLPRKGDAHVHVFVSTSTGESPRCACGLEWR